MTFRFKYLMLLLLVVSSCKPRTDSSGLKDASSGGFVAIDQEFLDSTSETVNKSGRQAGILKAMSDQDMEAKRRALYRDVASLSSVATDLVIWFDDVKERSAAGKIPEFSRSVDSAEFDKVQGYLATSQLQVVPLLSAEYWQDLTSPSPNPKFKSKYEEIRKSLEYYEKGFGLASGVISRWSGGGTQWVSKSYARVKDFERRMIEQKSAGQFPSLKDVEAAYAKDKQIKSLKSRALLQDLGTRTNPPGEWRGQYMMKLMAEIPEIAGLYSEPTGVSECYSVWEHTRRVIAIWYDQLEAYGYPANAKLPPALMAVTVALHDIGKPVDVHRRAELAGRPYDCNRPFTGKYDSSGQHVHNADIVRGVLKGIGATEQQQNIGFYLHGSDVLGEFAKDEIGRQEALSIIDDSAKAAGISSTEFFTVLRPFYVADAGSYPAVYGRYIAFPQQAGPGGWGRFSQGSGSNEVAKLTTTRGALAQLEQALATATPPKVTTPKAAVPPATPPPTKIDTPVSTETDGDGPLAGAPVAPGPNPVQTIKAQPADTKAKQVVSTIVPPAMLDLSALGKGGFTQQPSSAPEQSSAFEMPELSKPDASSQAPAAKPKKYTVDDYCCNKVFVSASGRTKFYFKSSQEAIWTQDGVKSFTRVWTMNGQICLKSDRWPNAVCMSPKSDTELTYKELTLTFEGKIH